MLEPDFIFFRRKLLIVILLYFYVVENVFDECTAVSVSIIKKLTLRYLPGIGAEIVNFLIIIIIIAQNNFIYVLFKLINVVFY